MWHAKHAFTAVGGAILQVHASPLLQLCKIATSVTIKQHPLCSDLLHKSDGLTEGKTLEACGECSSVIVIQVSHLVIRSVRPRSGA